MDTMHPVPEAEVGRAQSRMSAPVDARVEDLKAESARHHLLIVEDDVPLARLLSVWLGGEGFAATTASTGEAALEMLRNESFDMVLLDLNLPGMDGVAILKQVQVEWPGLPVMVLSGRNHSGDALIALNNGADDYLVKPFSLVELLARIRARLRRSGAVFKKESASAPPGLTIHRDEFCVERDGRRIALTPREFALLEFLMQQSPKPVSRATLMEQVWQVPFDPTTNIVDVDTATAAEGLAQAEAQNSAVLEAAAKALPTSLLDYLK